MSVFISINLSRDVIIRIKVIHLLRMYDKKAIIPKYELTRNRPLCFIYSCHNYNNKILQKNQTIRTHIVERKELWTKAIG